MNPRPSTGVSLHEPYAMRRQRVRPQGIIDRRNREAASMISHLLIVAIGFRLTGALLGIAAIAELVELVDTALMLRRLPPPDNGPPLDIGTYGLVGLLSNGGRGVGKVMYAFLTGPANWLITLLTIVMLLVLLFSALLYLVGRGIGHHATWARVVAIMMSLGLILVSSSLATVMERNLAPLAAVPVGLSLYTLWILIWRFA
jgi:hypothetical protein